MIHRKNPGSKESRFRLFSQKQNQTDRQGHYSCSEKNRNQFFSTANTLFVRKTIKIMTIIFLWLLFISVLRGKKPCWLKKIHPAQLSLISPSSSSAGAISTKLPLSSKNAILSSLSLIPARFDSFNFALNSDRSNLSAFTIDITLSSGR